ncbi:aminotransferase class III-fold pyridoxal phosphate-dependent enzyme [Yasminevirus sp. GU-2018]|uniref:Aminotransferase class III-fold pyridoxal phosphate-dependent enzyme n=1 Tax=Yasminevirus sp. GU-2018 TaxID=2420051 RepID=A0A5K0U9D3_9VIRU|nr:aminotransferase class III-fold pyridoxal phosphate-dependent enzyme [Yasminevirus sp. GU-2018]
MIPDTQNNTTLSATVTTFTTTDSHTSFQAESRQPLCGLNESLFSELNMHSDLYKNRESLEHVLAIRNSNEKSCSSSDNHVGGSKFVNFYEQKAVSPYTPAFGKGPWIVTDEGGIIYDAGGYGMLGFGHNDDDILRALSKEQVMANILTPSKSQITFSQEINKHASLYEGVLALNSGSETNELAFRIADAYFKSNHSDKKPVIVILSGSFHGRTYLSGQASDSCREKYEKYLSTYSRFMDIYKLKINNITSVKDAFNTMKQSGQVPLLTLMEPVMGEGNPGVMITPEFYKAVRDETRALNSLLHIDSVQAGIRTTGELSFTTYSGFNIDRENMPDMEVFSKAINGGQYPLSILAVKNRDMYKYGIYGNTMTANPRGLDVGTCVLRKLTPELKANIVAKGQQLKSRLMNLMSEFPTIINGVTGTGLLVAVHLNEKFNVFDLEKRMRLRGVNLIHGGKNGLRLTPWFNIDDNEIELIYTVMRSVFDEVHRETV